MSTPNPMAEPQPEKPHVGILPSPGLGHYIPLFEFAKRLVLHHGIRVTLIVINTEASAAQNSVLRARPLPPDLQIFDLPPTDISSLVSNHTTLVTRLCLITRESIRPLKTVLIDLQIKALVIDLFTTQAFDVCRELCIPAYSFFTASANLMALSLYLPALDREVDGEFMDLSEPVRVPGCTPVKTEDLPDPLRDRKTDEYKWFLFHASRLSLASGIFANTWHALEPVTLLALKQHQFFQDIPTPPIHHIGPLIKEDEPLTEFQTTIVNWLDNQPVNSVLLVCFGSGGALSSNQLTELAWGLEMSGQRFILVAREPTDAAASSTYFNVTSDGSDGTSTVYLPEGFRKRTEGMGLVVPMWVPQVTVLQHGSTGGFLSHCGWNSCLESLAQGVPMIAWPLYAEQRINAAMMTEEVGVAVKVGGGGEKVVIGREEIERVVRLVMEGEEGRALRRRAEELKDSAKEQLKHGGGGGLSLSYDLISSVFNVK